MSQPPSEATMREPHKLVSKRALIYLNQVLDITPHILIRISTFLYYNALKRNTLDSIEAINNTNNPDKKGVLVRRFLRFKSNEAKYVQVAGAVVIASVTSCLSWDSLASSHWSASAFFYSSIVFALVAIVTGAQQQMVLPGEDIDLKNLDLDIITAKLTKGGRHDDRNHFYQNKKLVFALQTPLMLFSFAVATFLAGLFSVIFSPLGSSTVWGDSAKIAVFFGVVNVAVIVVFVCNSRWIYQIPELNTALTR